MTAPATYLDKLNPEQRRAVEHGADDDVTPLLVIAGAGSGKTNTLAHRVAHLILNGADPARILLLTFTRRAAHEMLSRAERLVGSASTKVHGGTFHATGHRLLRQFGRAANMPSDFSIMDQGDAVDLVGIARAVVANPRIILADEPTGNLHSAQGKEIMDMFKRLNEEGTTIVQVTHSETNAAYGNRIVRLEDGWIVNQEQEQKTAAY